ncbi:hypothetical protein ACFX2G_044602 [Malus domestica]
MYVQVKSLKLRKKKPIIYLVIKWGRLRVGVRVALEVGPEVGLLDRLRIGRRVGMLGRMVDILGGRRVLLLGGGGDNNAGWETDAIQAEGDQRELTPQFGHLMLQFSGAGTLWLCL